MRAGARVQGRLSVIAGARGGAAAPAALAELVVIAAARRVRGGRGGGAALEVLVGFVTEGLERGQDALELQQLYRRQSRARGLGVIRLEQPRFRILLDQVLRLRNDTTTLRPRDYYLKGMIRSFCVYRVMESYESHKVTAYRAYFG